MKHTICVISIATTLLLGGCGSKPEPIKTIDNSAPTTINGVSDQNMAGATQEQRNAAKAVLGAK